MQTAVFDEYRMQMVVTDDRARLRWCVPDRYSRIATRADAASFELREDVDFSEPEHVRRFVRRWLPVMADRQGWL